MTYAVSVPLSGHKDIHRVLLAQNFEGSYRLVIYGDTFSSVKEFLAQIEKTVHKAQQPGAIQDV